jgi:hypothetical protein
MTTFYLLPPRPLVAETLSAFVKSWLPGAEPPQSTGNEMTEMLDHLARRGGVYIVHREDIPDGVDLNQALREDFGAEVGDNVVEVRLNTAGERTSRSWRIAP